MALDKYNINSNMVVIGGKIAKGFKTGKSKTGSMYAFGSICNEHYIDTADKPYKTFIDFKAFGPHAKEFSNLQEGSTIVIRGLLLTNSYQNSKNETIYFKYINVLEVKILSNAKPKEEKEESKVKDPFNDEDLPF